MGFDLKKRWRALSRAQRIALLTSLSSTLIAVTTILIIFQQAFSVITGLEHNSSKRNLDIYEVLFQEQISRIKDLTITLSRIYAANASIVRQNASFSSGSEISFSRDADKALISAIFERQVFSFPDLRMTRIISLSSDTGGPSGEEISLVSWRNGVPLSSFRHRHAVPLDQAFVASAAAKPSGSASLGPLEFSQENEADTHDVVISIRAATVVMNPLNSEKMALLIIELDLSDFVQRILNLSGGGQSIVSLWPVNGGGNSSGGIEKKGDGTFQFLAQTSYDAYGKAAQDHLIYPLEISDGLGNPVVRILQVRARADASSKAQFLIALTLFLSLGAAIVSVLTGRVIAALLEKTTKLPEK